MNIYTQWVLVGEKRTGKILTVWPQVQDTENTNHGCNSVLSAQVIYTYCFNISVWEVEIRLTFILVELGKLSLEEDGKILWKDT